jgi:hypothetical protein
VRAEDLIQVMAPALAAGEPIPGPRELVDLPADVIAPLVGRYTLTPDGVLDVAADGGGVSITAEGANAIRVLLPIPEAVGTEAASEHETGVAAFLAGETAEGRAELDQLEAELGPLLNVAIEGTIFAEGELRTYATLEFETETLLAWVALSDGGSLGAIDVGGPWPSLRMGATGDGLVFVPRDDPSESPPIEVEFAEDGSELVIFGTDGETTAIRSASTP